MIEVYSRDSFETQVVDGDFLNMVNMLNMASVQGKQFVVLEQTNGEPVAIEARNIIKFKPYDESGFVGS